MQNSDELYEFDAGQKVILGKGKYQILRKLARRRDKNKLFVSYYAKAVSNEPPGLLFIKTSTFYKHQPTEFCRLDLEAHHQKFRRMEQMIPLFKRVDGAAPEIYDTGVFKPLTNNAFNRQGIKLDYLVSKRVGDVDLKVYLTGRDDAIREALEIDGERAKEIVAGHFKGTHSSLSAYARKEFWRKHDFEPEVFKGLKPPIWYKFAEALTKNLKRLHNHGLVHGQLSTYTVRLKLETGEWQPVFVDFEESQPLAANRNDDKAEKADETVDITGLGKILLYLACGKEWDEVRGGDKKSAPANDWPRLSKTELQELVTKAVCAPLTESSTRELDDDIHLVGMAKIIDKCLREGGGDRDREQDQYLCCEDIAEELAIFGALLTDDDSTIVHFLGHQDQVEDNRRRKVSKALQEQLTKVQECGDNVLNAAFNWPPGKKKASFFHAIWASKLQQLRSSLEAMSRKHYEVHGDREELIDHLTRSLAGLQEGDIYLTLTRPSYWSQQNLGSHGRFLSVNQIVAVQKKVHTIRLFMMKDKELETPAVRKVLEYHKKFHSILKTRGGFKTDLGAFVMQRDASLQKIINTASKKEPTYYTGVSIVKQPVSPRDSLLRTTSKHVALILSKATGTCVSISFHDHKRPYESSPGENFGEEGGARRIHKVRFTLAPWDGKELQFAEHEFANEFIREMDYHLHNAEDIATIGGSSSVDVATVEPTLAAPTDTQSFTGWKEVSDD